jgi:hypothetical protein
MGIHPIYDAKLTTNIGRKTLKPVAAAKPIPIKALLIYGR